MGAREWGVDTGYHDAKGQWHDADPDTVARVLEGMGADGRERPPDSASTVRFARPGQELPVEGPCTLTTEDGGEVDVEGALPPDVPLGYHRLTRRDDGMQTTLVVSPGRCPLPADAPTWGWAVQLYAVRSASSWGIGDLADLGRLGRWSAGELGAGLVLVNPLHAAHPTLPQSASPYYPSSRRFRNPLYLRVEDVEGAAAPEVADVVERCAAAGHALNADRHIDRDAVFGLKMEALGRLWEHAGANADFDRWCQAEGDALGDYAAFCVLAEQHEADWRNWPDGARHPDGPRVAEARRDHADRWRFHQWLQWLLDRQLRDASGAIPVVHDLAVGVDPGGADAWLWKDTFADGMAVGAPPDEFNTKGQNWGLPPWDPWRLRAAGYQPFIQTIRAALRHAGGLRLDHVMGLFRLWWIPSDAAASDGVYVRYPAGDLLDLVALECDRAGAYAVGEDLGTVEPEVRDELARRHVLSYRLLWFEDKPPAEYPEQALAAVTTHDLPTVAGLWTGSDLRNQHDIGMEPNEEGTAQLRHKLQRLAGLDDGAPVDEVVARTYAALADAPSMLLTAALDDALGVQERPNMPGTTDQWPNWSIALPVPLEDIESDPRPRTLAEALHRDPAAP